MNGIDVYKEVLDGKRAYFPKMFWEGEEGRERARKISRYVIEEVYCLTEDTVAKEIRYNMFVKNKLSRMMKVVYNDVLFNLVDHVYPNKYKAWELSCAPMGFWAKKENRREAVKWIRKKYNWTEEEFVRNITTEMLKGDGFSGLMNHYQDSLYSLVADNIDIEFMPWEMSRVGKNFWAEKKNRISAMHWLIKKYGWSEEEFIKNINHEILKENGLRGLVNLKYGGNLYALISDIFPNRFSMSDFKHLKDCKDTFDRFEIEKKRIEDAKKRYSKSESNINEKVKNLIIENATKGVSKCLIQLDDMDETSLELLKKQGFEIDIINKEYCIKW